MPNKRKILLVGNCQGVHLRRWVSHLAGKFEVRVLTESSCRHAECLYFEEIAPRRWKWLSSVPKIGFLVRVLFLKKYIFAEEISLVHIHFLGGFGTRVGLALLASPFFRTPPVVISLWGSDVALSQNPSIRKLKRYVLERADVVTAVCNSLAERAKEIAPFMKRLEIIQFGVDLKRFNPQVVRPSRELAGSRKILRIGFFKHLKEIYGPAYLVKSFAAVGKEFKNAELFLAGEGELKDGLKRLAQRLKVSDKVHFLGFVDNVPQVMSVMDITVLPSLSEGLPVAALESQALGIPVVASRVGGVPEAVQDGKTGLLVPPRDVVALSGAIRKLLADGNLRGKMGRAGQEFVKERYSWEESVRKMTALYRELLKITGS